MGQKVHPIAFRLNTTTTWSSRWFAPRKAYRSYLHEDVLIREEIRKRFRDAGITSVDIERSTNTVTVTIQAARPGVIIGRGGQGAEGLKRDLREQFLAGGKTAGKHAPMLQVNIMEVDRPALQAEVTMQQIVSDLEKRIPFRRAMRQAMGRVERAGALGIRVQVSGRLLGAEIARREVSLHGSVPLHTIRADISYAQGFARTIYGSIGVKVWIYRGEVFSEKPQANSRKPQARSL